MIRSVSSEGIRIGTELYTDAVAISMNEVIDDWPAKAVDVLGEEDFRRLLDRKPEVIVLGTGASSVFPPRELVFAMARRQVGFEVMDTAAAARTYNVLTGDGRQVAALLYSPTAERSAP